MVAQSRRYPISAFIALAILLASLGGCSWFSVKNDPAFKDLEGKVAKLDDHVTTEIRQLREAVQRLETHLTQTAPDKAPNLSASMNNRMSAIPPREFKKEYNQARTTYVKGDYARAAGMFQRLVEASPRDDLAPNARYWLAESLYSQERFKEAISEFQKVIEHYPGSDKAPDAMLKLAYSYNMLNDGKTAMDNLRTLLNRYPKSRAANMVRKGQTLFRNPQ